MLIRLKTQEEIEGFAKAGRLAAQVMRMLVDAAKPNTTTKDLDQLARNACSDANATPTFLGYNGFPAAICTSLNKELVHGIPSNSRYLQYGDLLKIDLGVTLNGYIGDIARTIVVGQELPNQLVFQCKLALLRGIAAAKAGADIGDIGAAIFDIGKCFGFKVVMNYGGHGIDRYVLHADPYVPNFKTQNFLRLRAGMVLAIEPMFIDAKTNNTTIADDGWTVLTDGPCVHFEHTIALSEIGEPRILTLEDK